jgi:hypothetical protein
MSWIVPALGYVAVLAALGVASRFSLETLSWQQLLPWMRAA